MADLYLHQMQRGGIINADEDESNVISIQSEDAREEVYISFYLIKHYDFFIDLM